MKTIKILLGIIAINLTLITIIQTGVWPSKVQAREFNNSLNTHYGLVPLNENGNISIERNGCCFSWVERSRYGNIGV